MKLSLLERESNIRIDLERVNLNQSESAASEHAESTDRNVRKLSIYKIDMTRSM